ncbi:PREDICTED: microtubule-associated protein TORTIFOLIA1-like [Camelina sativa]|uniref:Microtubule-associated protein TORTIFOLIA1-like n=1 Tax=Camelina sativa TaxID=90675 RepID=A0ABM0Z684_CAMSA|nr:PREDICTED: microtubule-associated protein TORTIFOLIA1-like [Camelina sativa]
MPSVQIRSSPPPAVTVTDLKQRVIACLNRLSDRDTLSLATAELDSIALNLSPETFPLFINCLQSTDSSAKSPVRKHCVSLLSVLSRSHGDSLAPHLSKMVSTVLRRLRDPDSSVRAACATASVDMTTSISGTPFSILLGPMIETLIHDCDPNAQIGAAMCLAAAVDAADELDVEQLQKALPKIGKLLKSEGFKAKPELLGVIGSVIGAVGGRNSDKAVLDWLLPNVSEYLSSNDWRARKAAAEAMAKVAMAEEELAPQYKKACVGILESRRFDKVKLVRETMNRTLSLWKQLEGDSKEVSEPTSSSKSAHSGLSATSGKISNALKGNDRNSNAPLSSKSNDVEPLDRSNTSKDVEQEAMESKDKRNHSTLGAKRNLFPAKTSKVKENRSNKLNKSQVVQSSDEESPKTDSGSSSSSSQAKNNAEELSLIRNQITQIEKQQSSLLDLFQKFMESSQNGMQSLERRVRGLETSFSVISTDLLVSRTITRNENHKRNERQHFT